MFLYSGATGSRPRHLEKPVASIMLRILIIRILGTPTELRLPLRLRREILAVRARVQSRHCTATPACHTS